MEVTTTISTFAGNVQNTIEKIEAAGGVVSNKEEALHWVNAFGVHTNAQIALKVHRQPGAVAQRAHYPGWASIRREALERDAVLEKMFSDPFYEDWDKM